ncbi:MAG: M24 family metallopeptidase, partial [bacterium]
MISIKNKVALGKMREAGHLLASVMRDITPAILGGVTTKELDAEIEQRMRLAGLHPTCKGFKGYRHVSCISVNDSVVHGVPSAAIRLQPGDCVTVDMVGAYKGYHADMARWMGYGADWHDHGFKINVHLSGKGGPAKFLRTLGRLSTEARNLITIENDELTNGIDVTLAVADHVALVLDIHHHWINTGEYITPTDPRAQRVIESWRGVRPTLHYSVSREDCLVDHSRTVKPDLSALLAQGYKKQKLRAHSDFYWNEAVNDWALTFADQFNIQCEAKGKNLARDQLYQ